MWFSAHFEEDALFLKMLVAALYYNVLTLLIVFFFGNFSTEDLLQCKFCGFKLC